MCEAFLVACPHLTSLKKTKGFSARLWEYFFAHRGMPGSPGPAGQCLLSHGKEAFGKSSPAEHFPHLCPSPSCPGVSPRHMAPLLDPSAPWISYGTVPFSWRTDTKSPWCLCHSHELCCPVGRVSLSSRRERKHQRTHQTGVIAELWPATWAPLWRCLTCTCELEARGGSSHPLLPRGLVRLWPEFQILGWGPGCRTPGQLIPPGAASRLWLRAAAFPFFN